MANVSAFLAGMRKGRPDFQSSWMDDRWKRNKAKNKGRVLIWLPVHSSAVTMAYVHEIPELRTKRDGGEFLKYAAKYTSPDPELVHRFCGNKHRQEDGNLKYPPIRDPFLLLRDYLYEKVRSGRIAPDTEIFGWRDPKDGSRKIWTAELLADLKEQNERQREEWNIHLRAKREYVFCVVRHDEPNAIKKVRVPSTLAEKMESAIANRIETLGDNGDPMQRPVAFQWTYDGSKQAQSMYEVQVVSELEMPAEVRDLIHSEDVPDVTPYGRPRPGDKFRIMDTMLQAAEAVGFDFPVDEVFVDAWEDQRAEESDDGGERETRGTASTASRHEAPIKHPDERRDAVGAATGARTEPVSQEVNRSGDGAQRGDDGQQRRRRKVSAPTTLPLHGTERAVRTEELMPCADDGCALRSHPQWSRCPSCGCEFDLDPEDGPAVAPPPMDWLEENSWPGALQAGADRDQARPAPTVPAPAGGGAKAGDGGARCWSCNFDLSSGPADKCGSCGAYQDDIPF